jgi:hypothetical protein
MTADTLAYKVLQNVIRGERGYERAGGGCTKLRTFLPTLLDRTNVIDVKWGRKKHAAGLYKNGRNWLVYLQHCRVIGTSHSVMYMLCQTAPEG